MRSAHLTWSAALLVAIGFGGALPASAATPAIDVPAIVAASSLIVVGRAIAPRLEDGPTGSTQIVAVAVRRTLKSGGATTGRIDVRLDVSNSDFPTVANGQDGIFFLKRLADGRSYAATDSYHPVVAAGPQGGASGSVERDALTNVAAELVRALGSVPDTAAISAASYYYGISLALRSIPEEVTEAPVRALAASGSGSGRLWAIEGLLTMHGTPDVESRKADYIRTITPVLMRPASGMEFIALRLAGSLEGNIRAPEAVPALTRLLGSDEVEVRRAVASALSDINSRDIIRPLAKAALQDDDDDVRYFAVNGVAAATGHDVPPYALFKTDEPAQLNAARIWAGASGR